MRAHRCSMLDNRSSTSRGPTAHCQVAPAVQRIAFLHRPSKRFFCAADMVGTNVVAAYSKSASSTNFPSRKKILSSTRSANRGTLPPKGRGKNEERKKKEEQKLYFELFCARKNGDCSRKFRGHQAMTTRSASQTASPPKTSRANGVFRGLRCKHHRTTFV